MNIGPSDVADLGSQILAAALNPSRWSDFAKHVHKVTGGVRTHIAGRSASTRRLLGPVVGGYESKFITSYEDYFCHRNVWLEAFMQARCGTFMSFSEMYPLEELLHTEFYNGWVKPQDDIYGGGAVMLFRDADMFLAFGGHIRARDIDRLSKPFAYLVRLLTPQLQQAIEIGRSFQNMAVSNSIEILNGNTMPTTALVGPDGRLLYANSKAREWLSQGKVLQTDAFGRVTFKTDRVDIFFRRALQSINELEQPIPTNLRFLRGDINTEFVINAARFIPNQQLESPFGLLYSGDDRCILLTIEEKTVGDQNVSTLLRRRQLTRSEIEVAIALSESKSLSEIAASRNVSVNTLRNQRQAVFAKLNVKSQGQLIRLILKPEELK